MPQHILRLVSILVIALILAVVAANYFTDPSFYRFGHYRADAVVELASGTPKFQGSDSCQDCHSSVSQAWDEGIHVAVECEVCHGVGLTHPDDNKMMVPTDTVRLCSQCHEAMPARPKTQPQIVIDEHPFPHEQPLACTTCHNAHAPGIGSSREKTASPAAVANESATVAAPAKQGAASPVSTKPVPALVTQCGACHGAAGQGVGGLFVLTGKQSADLVIKLQQFRSGELSGPVMNGIAASLNDDQILELAEYYAALPNPE
jgi:cytochrome c553